MKTARSVTPSTLKAACASPKELIQKTRQLDTLVRLVTHETGKSVRFEIAAEQGSKVYVACTFNNCDPTALGMAAVPTEGVFKATLSLPAGTCEYRFVVNGVWQMEDASQDSAQNGRGTLGSGAHA